MNPFAHMSPGLSLAGIGLALTLLATALLCPAAAADPNPQTAAPIKPPVKKILTPRNPKPTGWQGRPYGGPGQGQGAAAVR